MSHCKNETTKHIIECLNRSKFFRRYAASVPSYKHKMVEVKKGKTTRIMTDKDLRLIARGLRQMAKELIQNPVPEKPKKEKPKLPRRHAPDYAKIPEVISRCAEAYGLEENLLFAKVRTTEVVAARHLAFYILVTDYHIKSVYIAKHFDMNHTTVSHGLTRVQFAIDTKMDVYPKLMEIRRTLVKTLRIAA
jgi:hypothetical protein